MSYSATMLLHIAGGGVGLAAGALTLLAAKQSVWHKLAGNLFFVFILVMAASGAVIAFQRGIMLSTANGILVCYLVASSWMTVRRPPGVVGWFDKVALLVAVAVAVALVIFGMEAGASANGIKDGFPAPVFYFFASVATAAAAMDVRMLCQGGVSGAPRIARHLWRMGFALFMATAAFFLGQSRHLPESLQTPVFIIGPVVAVVLLVGYWLVRVLAGRGYRSVRG